MQSVVSFSGGSPNHGAACPGAACVARPDVVASLGRLLINSLLLLLSSTKY